MVKHPVEIILTLLRAQLGHETPSLTLKDKARLMEVIQMAGNQAVGPALHGGLQAMIKYNRSDVWQSITPMLKILENQNASRNQQVREACLRINTLLRNSGMNPVFVKGAAFILEDPDAAPWRFVSDIDLLISREMVHQAFIKLRDAGFSAAADPYRYDDKLHHHLPPLIEDASGFTVELHSRLLQEQDTGILQSGEVIEKACSIALPNGEVFLVPTPMHRCLHAILHCQHSNSAYRMKNVELRTLLDYGMISGIIGFQREELLQTSTGSLFQDEVYGFIQLASLLIGTEGLPLELADQKANSWSRQTIQEMTSPPSTAVKSARLAANYFASFVRDPIRIVKLATSLKDSRFRADLTKATQKRLGL